MNKLLKKTKKGFTLVELLVVIAILAVLASVSVVGYLGFTTKARNSNAMTELAQVREVLRAELIDGNEVSAEYTVDSTSKTIKMKYTDKTYYISDTAITAGGTTAVDLTTGLKALFTDLSDLSCTLSVTYGAAETVATGSEATGYYALTRIDYSRTNGGSAYWLVSNDSVTAGEYSAS